MTLSELQAMISFLSDDDAEIVQFVTQDLVAKGYGVYDTLEDICWSGVLEDVVQDKLEVILKRITFIDIKPKIEILATNFEQNLLQILHLTAKITYPRNAIDNWQNTLNALTNSLARETNPTYGITRNVSEFNRIFYETCQFSVPEPNNQYLIPNFMINDVLSRKIGDSTLLSMIYYLLAHNLKWELSVEPIILPNMVLLAAKNATRISPRYTQADIAFYINPADRGNIHSRKEIVNFLETNEIAYTPDMLLPCTVEQLYYSYLDALAICCEKNNRPMCAQEIRELAAIFVL